MSRSHHPIPILVVIVAVCALIVAATPIACGGDSGDPNPSPSTTALGDTPPLSPSSAAAEQKTTVRLYFLRGKQLGVAERQVPSTATIATATLAELFKGPTESERAAGLSTSLGGDISVNSLSIENGLATVDLSSGFGTKLSPSNPAALLPTAQIVYTLAQFPSVKQVEISIDGVAFNPKLRLEANADGTIRVLLMPAPGADTKTRPQTWSRSTLSAYEPLIFVESPGVGAVLANPFRLSGKASVYEATFLARLQDNSGRRIANVTVQASEGAPGRGSFEMEIAYSTAASEGILIVYAESMDDGSHMYELRIPVTFAE